MTRDLDHVFLTRFNLPSEGAENLIRAREDWLRQRVRLFERYTLPSMVGQTCSDFRWIVYFDPESPDWLKRHIDDWDGRGLLTPVLRTSVGQADLAEDLRALIGSPAGVLLTTNLDNDDGLATDFVERLQAATVPGPKAAVYLRYGLIKSPAGLYLRDDPVNAFCSVREVWSQTPSTCWADWHNMLGEHMPVTEVGGEPGWLQVIHTNNVSNRVRGRLVSPQRYHRAFGALIEDVAPPTRGQQVKDLLLERPSRVVRESARATAKRTVMAVGGKKALDRVKLIRERASTRLR